MDHEWSVEEICNLLWCIDGLLPKTRAGDNEYIQLRTQILAEVGLDEASYYEEFAAWEASHYKGP